MKFLKKSTKLKFSRFWWLFSKNLFVLTELGMSYHFTKTTTQSIKVLSPNKSVSVRLEDILIQWVKFTKNVIWNWIRWSKDVLINWNCFFQLLKVLFSSNQTNQFSIRHFSLKVLSKVKIRTEIHLSSRLDHHFKTMAKM